MKKVVILGSTGSIGINTLKVVDQYPDKFKVVGLSAYNNIDLLEQQIRKYSPRYVGVNGEKVVALRKKLGSLKIRVLNAQTDLGYMVSLKAVDVVVIGMSGSRALAPFMAAIKEGKTIAPANKEALVIAGDLLMRQAKRHKAQIIPVDSEQSAIFQCLQGQPRKFLKKIYLTASGGVLKDIPQSKFKTLSREDILLHPRWKMGMKITVDSATLMNKGFEVIEALRLFELKTNEIEVVVHPEAIIHSMVGFKDGSIIAQLGITDMRLPIQYAMTYPERWPTHLPDVDFFKLKKLNFEKPNLKKFPSLSLAFHVAKEGGTLPSVLNAADEVAVAAFLDGDIAFTKIYSIIEKIVRSHKIVRQPDLKEILEADRWAREEVGALALKAC
ncbi:MAG: 1-deoxy-D-xylulose-5-phosphate reductoisomerase [Candidatus Omnitrophica bacterium]|nr:1-deoxy-D-xylulose-5-phosphate reductoisomerase [Candidatus Omnitrophota bacterium]